MWDSFKSLCWTTYQASLARASSSSISIFWLGLAAILLSFIFFLFFEWLRGGRTMASVKPHLKGWTALAGTISALIVVWIVLFVNTFIHQVYDKHKSLSDENATLTAEKSGLLAKVYKLQHPSPAPTTTKSELPSIAIVQSQIEPGIGLNPATPKEKSNPGVEVVITAQRDLSSPTLEIECDRACDYVYGLAIGNSTKFGPPHVISPTKMQITLIIPALLAKYKQLAIDFRSQDNHPIRLRHVLLFREKH
jgi:hypothetical protein